MLDKIFYIIMVPMVYAAFAVLLLGITYQIIKILRAPKQSHTLQIFPEHKPKRLRVLGDTFLLPHVRRESIVFWFFLVIYHIAFLLLILGHLDLIPAVNIMDPESKHMVGYGGIGVALTASIIYFIGRRLKSPVREISAFGDYLILLLLLFIFLSGDMMSWANSWGENGFVLEKADFGNYMKVLLSFSFEDPRPVLDSSHYVHVVIHVFLANLFLMLFPFTKFMHTFFSMALNGVRRG